MIDEILTDIGDAYRLIPIKDLLKNNWMNFGSQKYKCGDRCLYSRPNVDLCNGFFIAVFERNFDVPLPEFRRKKTNVNILEQTNLNVEDEIMSRKRKKRGKRKNKKDNSTIDEQMEKNERKLPEDDGESGKTEIKNEKMNICPELDHEKAITGKITILPSESISRISKDTKLEKSKKRKRSKHDVSPIEEAKEIAEICDIETKQDEETEIEPLKKKKKKKKKENTNQQDQ